MLVKLLGIVVLCTAMIAQARAEIVPLELWYDEPATDWESEALPIGNGALGAMIFGGIARERLQLNEKTLWTGGPGSKSGYDFGIPAQSLASAVHDIADKLERSTQLDPKDVVRRIGHKARGYGDYQTFGDLYLDFGFKENEIRGYRRELDLDEGVARVTFTHNGVQYQREYFASYPDQVIVIRLTADKPARIHLRAQLSLPDNRTREVASENGRIVARGALHDNGLEYEGGVQLLADGGLVSDLPGGQVGVVGADSVVLLFSAATGYAPLYPDYRGAKPGPAVRSRLQRAAAASYEVLRSRHEEDYRALFDRVALDIGQTKVDMPTDEQLARFGTDALPDRALEALYFQYGRYLLIASSRAGSLPANLQGVWNQTNTPPWNADYHVNINLQMNYWPAETTNLCETAAPLFDFIDSLIEPGRHSARSIADADGWTLFLNTNVWGYTGLIDWPTAFWQPESAAWLTQHYYERYRFARDESFLRTRAWPAMKEAALFWLDHLRTDPRDGMLVVSPSYSPEHGPFTAGAAMSQQIVFDLFTNVIEAADRLGEKEFASRVREALAKLDPGLHIGSWQQLQEWKIDIGDPKNDHRHVSHLFALHPGRQITPHRTPEYAAAARVSLEARGDGGTGWSKAWKINFWARLLDGDRAHRLLGEQLKASTLENLFDTHPPFQIDGNFGATAGIAEMLVQSHDGEIHFLPALPEAWPSGSVRGLRARGDATIDIHWREGAAQSITIHAGHDGPLTMRSTIFANDYVFTDASGRDIPLTGSGNIRTFHARADEHYELERK